jgi:hypothetical protein
MSAPDDDSAKLQCEGRAAYRFSPKATTAELRKLLVQRRLQDGRHQNDGWWHEAEEGRPPPMDRYEADGRPIYSYRRQRQYEDGRPWDIHGRQYQRLPFLSKETARRLWNELGELAEDLHGTFGGEHVYWERLQRIDGFDDYVTDAPYEHWTMLADLAKADGIEITLRTPGGHPRGVEVRHGHVLVMTIYIYGLIPEAADLVLRQTTAAALAALKGLPK